MKKILLPFVLCFTLFSCEKNVTSYMDLVREEKVYLKQFMQAKGFKVLDTFPKDSVFAENEYFLLDNGVYLRVLDNGDAKPPTKDTDIQTIAKGAFLYTDNKERMLFYTDKFESFDGFESLPQEMKWPLRFRYGDPYFSGNEIIGKGYLSALQYAGNHSTVSMIVPFEVGSPRQMGEIVSAYFERVTFTFE
ncbi:MAG: DUF4827 domain-containing protein [Tannerellaceae bacterium]|jgi:hypothetical protein|nr:DUF4827 domain-containing protein [Tannerellaceae bacterium]